MRHKAMLSHYLRSLGEEKEFEEWDSGHFTIPADEDRYYRVRSFGSKTLVERGRTNDIFFSLIKDVGSVVCRTCSEPGEVDCLGYLYCNECLGQLKDDWNNMVNRPGESS